MTAALVMTATLAMLSAWSLWRLPALHPVQLWSVPWAVSASLYSAHLLPYRWITWTTALLVAGGAVAFAGATVLGERTTIAKRGTTEAFIRVPRRSLRLAAAVTALVTGVVLVAFLGQAVRGYGVRATVITSQELRDSIGAGGFSITIKYVYTALASVALCSLAAARATTRRERRVWALLALGLAASTYFSTGRSTIVVAVLVGLVAYAFGRGGTLPKRRVLASTAGLAVLALGVFIVGGHAIGKTFENHPSLSGLPGPLTEHDALNELALPYEYASASIPALDVQMERTTAWGVTYGCAAFAELCRVIERLGPDLAVASRVRPFTSEPLTWNTYTVFDIPLLDGGLVLAVPILTLVGFMLGALWTAARQGGAIAVSLYALLAPGLVTAYGQFNFTAPHLIGAIIISGMALAVCDRVAGRRLDLRESGTARAAA